MDWEYYVVIAIILLVAFAILLTSLASGQKKKAFAEYKARLVEKFGFEHVREAMHHSHAWQAESEDTIYLIKPVWFNPKHELIITNRLFWCINDDPKSWKRSSKPVLVDHVKGFLEYEVSTSKLIKRVAIILPDCHNITRYLNESDVELVTPKKEAYGVYFVRGPQFDDFFG